jgi:hypothetical protein
MKATVRYLPLVNVNIILISKRCLRLPSLAISEVDVSARSTKCGKEVMKVKSKGRYENQIGW